MASVRCLASRLSVAFALLCVSGCDSEWISLGRAPGPALAVPGSAGATSPTPPHTGGTFAGAGGVTGGASAGTAGQAGSAATLTEPLFRNVERVLATSAYADDNPTLTADLRELYFSSKGRPGGKGNVDIWIAKRDAAAQRFGEPVLVAAVNSELAETSPAISADGLTLWFGGMPVSGGLGGYDILRSTRPSTTDTFGLPVLVAELSSDKDDIPRPTGNRDLTMPLSSRRGGGMYQTYLSSRRGAAEPFDAPTLVQELVTEGANFSDAFLTDDGLVLYFAHAVNERADLFVARRASANAPFGEPLSLTSINTEYDDRDPWLSPDGSLLFFASDRDNPGTLSLFQATLVTSP